MKHFITNSLPFFLLLLAFLTAQCQSGHRQPGNENQQSVRLRTICQLPGVLVESSGLAIEGSNRIWSHEDSGNTNEIYCFDTTGALLRTITIGNVENIDWEDMASDNEDTWYIGDAGNNNNDRTDLAVYIIPDPETISGNTVEAGIIRFSLEDQTSFPPSSPNRNFDIEAMVWHADSLFLFTKDRSNPFTGITKMYVLPDKPGTYIAQLVDSYHVGNTEENGRITSADINHHTGELVLLTNTKLVSFTSYPGNRFFDGEVVEYNFTTLPGQNEAVGFVSASKLYMTEEGNGNNAGNLYEIKLPLPQSIEKPVAQAGLMQVFPNPAADRIRVTCPVQGIAMLELSEINGRLLLQQPFTGDDTLKIGNLVPGMYIVKLRNESMQVSQRVIRL